jgi:aldose 1-epimerase
MTVNFGISPGNQAVSQITIGGHGMTARILTWGATLQDLRLDGYENPLVIGFTNFQDYLDHSQYHGVIAGRVINRLGGARAIIDGVEHRLASNQSGGHMLHGGTVGYGARDWRLVDRSAMHVTLALTDPDGSMGFPGTVETRCRYSLIEGPSLRIDLMATSDRPTLLNLGHHSYFNLDGSDDIRAHHLAIAADRYLPTDGGCLPTGEIAPVAGTTFDFRHKREVAGDYDHNFCVADKRRRLTPVAELSSPRSGVSMGLLTTEPGLQFYTGQGLSGGGSCLGDLRNAAHAALCLEPQMWPDAPNHRHFPSIALTPDDSYHQISQFVFSHNRT